MEYASPIVLTRKKNGEYRLCVDYRTLNKYLIRDNYPLPLIEDQIDVLNGKKYFSLIDLKDGFYHIEIESDSVKYLSFVTPFGQYSFRRMPFGLKTAPSAFQRFINTALKELIESGDVVVYMDDILVATLTIEHHFEVLENLFRIMVKNKLNIRLDKCRFLFTTIEFLGYEISNQGTKPTKRGTEAVVNFPVPGNVKRGSIVFGAGILFQKIYRGILYDRKTFV